MMLEGSSELSIGIWVLIFPPSLEQYLNCPICGRRFSMVSNSTISDVSFSFDDGTMGFEAVGQAGTVGFCRVAVPEALIQALGDDELGILVNGEEPVVIREWSDGVYGYWYVRFANKAALDWVFVWVIVSGILVFLIVLGAIIGVYLMRRRRN